MLFHDTPAGSRAPARGCPVIFIVLVLTVEAVLLAWLVGRETRGFALAAGAGALALVVPGFLVYLAHRRERRLRIAEAEGREAAAYLERLKLAVDRHALVSETDAFGVILGVNDAFCTASGYTREELVGQNHRLITSGYHHPVFFRDLWRMITSGRMWRGEICNRRKDGTCFWVHVTIVPFVGPDGRPTRYLAVHRDISVEHALREKLRNAHDLLSGSEALARIGSWESDQTTGLVTCSPMAASLLGIPPDTPIPAASIPEIIAPEFRAEFARVRAAALEQHQSWDHEAQIMPPQRPRLWVRSRGSPVMANGRVVKLVGTIQDVDQSKRLALALEESNRQLEAAVARANQLAQDALAATQAKSFFLASMSHELRTPLNGVIGFTNLLQHTALSQTQHDYVAQIQHCGEALLDVINEVLDFSKIESGRLELEKTPFHLRETVESAIDFVAPRATEKKLDVVFDVAPDVPEAVVGDPSRLRQVLLNLLSNAVKFTAHGEVFLQVSRTKSEAPECAALCFTVRDTGIGIDATAAARLFQPFTQADASTTRRFGGTGLGLAICKRLVEHMGGTIGFDSTPGKGTTFRFTLHLPIVFTESLPAASAAAARPTLLTGCSVLIVDDNSTNRRVLAEQLGQAGLHCALAGSGAEALTLVRNGEHYDFAILDLLMPEMNGVALARALREVGEYAPRHLVLLSSLGTNLGDEVAGLFAATLMKPAKLSQLLDSLQRLAAPDSTAQQEAPPRQLSELRVLVVEDNPVNERVTRLLLRRLGVRADIASNGREAVEQVSQHDYDLVLMDVQMPEMDGLQATETIRREIPAARQPMIVALTANAVAGDEEMCLAAGMDSYLSKPVKHERLGEVVRRAATRAARRATAPA